jgi:hypothetical protein
VERQVVEPVDELVEVAAEIRNGVFGFMSTRNRRKLPAPSATQTHEPKTNVVP